MRRDVASLLAVLSLSSLLSLSTAQRSFANTKFDLSPDLPAEELPRPAISASEDESPKKFVRKPPLKAHRSEPVKAIAPQIPHHVVVSPRPPPGDVPISSGIHSAGAYATAGSYIAVIHVPDYSTRSAACTFYPGTGTPIRGQNGVQLIRVSSTVRDRIELWFRDDFDLRQCPVDASVVAEAFRRKFPRNLLRNGKEGVLADLLAARLKECHEKQRKNHWAKVYEVLGKMQLPASEAEECRSGLVQEQISCLNVQSYSCQFIQPSYQFRLVPTRIIVQEARLAEDGSDKCRKVVRKVKKQLE
ncbi:CRE-PQN-46 protein [Aphelenchoides avenae]|nr:CRE-PQN-46 protein [Aphelenchus avenae]